MEFEIQIQKNDERLFKGMYYESIIVLAVFVADFQNMKTANNKLKNSQSYYFIPQLLDGRTALDKNRQITKRELL